VSGVARPLLEAYDPDFRASMLVQPAEADDPGALIRAAGRLEPEARALLDVLLLSGHGADGVPERFRPLLAQRGAELFRAGLLLPRASRAGDARIHPLHYLGACRLNPAARDLAAAWRLPGMDATATLPAADARWDAVVIAALLESAPLALNQDGQLRKDAERRLVGGFGGDEPRWELALRYARVVGLARPMGGRLHGFPESTPRPLPDVAALFADATEAAAAAIVLRAAGASWTPTDAWLDALQAGAREVLHSPANGRYPGREVAFDAAGWAQVEAPVFRRAADVLHRCGLLDLAGGERTAFRRASLRAPAAGGFLLAADGEILVHVRELPLEHYGRLARLAPFAGGESLRRHRLCREGATADLAAGHPDPVDFLAGLSRTGVPPHLADSLREWRRSATRISVLTGVDVVEEADGRLRLARPGETAARTIDYTTPPRARFLYRSGEVVLLDGWDPLTVRHAVERFARFQRRSGDERIYVPELRPQPEPAPLLNRLRTSFGGELPGEIETLILAGAGLGPARVEPAVVVHLPLAAASAIRRDRVAAPLVRRSLGPDQVVVAAQDLDALRRRLRELGVGWADFEPGPPD
jgi:hypothetical protein